MVGTVHVWCPNCGKAFYFHKDLYKTAFEPRCPFCTTIFKQSEAADIWAEDQKRGWVTPPSYIAPKKKEEKK